MRIELASQTGHPVPQFVVHAESQVESMVLEAFVAYARQSERPVKFHLHGWACTNGRPSSFNFGYAFEGDEPIAKPVAPAEPFPGSPDEGLRAENERLQEALTNLVDVFDKSD